jgi:hypothetical protein
MFLRALKEEFGPQNVKFDQYEPSVCVKIRDTAEYYTPPGRSPNIEDEEYAEGDEIEYNKVMRALLALEYRLKVLEIAFVNFFYSNCIKNLGARWRVYDDIG